MISMVVSIYKLCRWDLAVSLQKAAAWVASLLHGYKIQSDQSGMHKAAFFCLGVGQGGRTWQPFIGGKNGQENVRQARIYNFRVKCVIFARNRKFAKLNQ